MPTQIDVAKGLEKTWQTLARTRNRAVLPLLAAGFRSRSPSIRDAAIRTAIKRVDIESHTQLIRDFAKFGDGERATVAEAHRTIPHHAAPALRAALLGSDHALCDNACQMILCARDYDSIPSLLLAIKSGSHRSQNRIAATILQLASRLHESLIQSPEHDERSQNDPSFARHRVLSALEPFLRHEAQQVRSEILDAFLLLSPREHPTLVSILRDSRHSGHQRVVDALTSSENPAVFSLLVELLRDSDAPLAVLEAIAQRVDRPFVENLLRSLKHPVPLRVLHNMSRLTSIAWLGSHREILLDLDGRAQAVAIALATASQIAPTELFDLLALLVREGLVEGRRAACQALGKFTEPPADMLVLAALDDPDSGVQAAAVRQLRPRVLPQALRVLVECLDSPSPEVRDAARSSLAEFNFVRYRAMFDLLDENAIKTTGVLVHKVDDAAVEGLIDELMSPSISARLRGIEMAVAMQATQDVCDQLVELAKHENVAVRKEALAALADCAGPKVLDALKLAASDKNQSIAATARQSLAQLRQPSTTAPPGHHVPLEDE